MVLSAMARNKNKHSADPQRMLSSSNDMTHDEDTASVPVMRPYHISHSWRSDTNPQRPGYCDLPPIRIHWTSTRRRNFEWYKNDVNDKAKANGGMQRIITLDGYIIPMSIRGGLTYIPMRTFTDKEFETLPHVIMTSDKEWDPSVLDREADVETKNGLTMSPPNRQKGSQSTEGLTMCVVTKS
ncbi:hypothetical protein IV203_032536 [Nitzschia inconspicua]|uniref:Uncharacterized protein n=1 Tax=Nitzschia inconspicua TaxID=303405 RepID=A0A9K3KJV3_9STRA|nr:hypothetical protein IV203_032536 [Nitzschia inconspicua]